MIRAHDVAIDDFAACRELGATVYTKVSKSTDRAVARKEQDRFPEELDSDWFLFDLLRPGDWMPIGPQR
jgi:hypothetical protein